MGARGMTSLLNGGQARRRHRTLATIAGGPRQRAAPTRVGRTYGGGFGKIEPGDLVALPSGRRLAWSGRDSSASSS